MLLQDFPDEPGPIREPGGDDFDMLQDAKTCSHKYHATCSQVRYVGSPGSQDFAAPAGDGRLAEDTRKPQALSEDRL